MTFVGWRHRSWTVRSKDGLSAAIPITTLRCCADIKGAYLHTKERERFREPESAIFLDVGRALHETFPSRATVRAADHP